MFSFSSLPHTIIIPLSPRKGVQNNVLYNRAANFCQTGALYVHGYAPDISYPFKKFLTTNHNLWYSKEADGGVIQL